MIDVQILHYINKSLDREREVQALASDRELARHLGISPKTLSLWRHGKHLPKAAIILIKLLIPIIEEENRS